MPGAVLVDVEARVRELVAARRPLLVELVRRALDLELERLVDVELEQRTNGNGAHPAKPAETGPATKVCRGCGRDLEIAQYEKRRNLCRRCRRDQLDRAREQRRATATTAAGGEPPRPGPEPDADG